MDRLNRRLPPLRALLAFEAVVRRGSVTAAAAELGKTQPSVSQHLRALEADLGVQLVRKVGRRVLPTPDGRDFYDRVAPGLRDIAAAAETVRSDSRGGARNVTLSVNFGFAHFRLKGVLDAVEEAFPRVNLAVRTHDRVDSREENDNDISVMFGSLARADDAHAWLFRETVLPVCAPAFAARHGLGATTTAERLATLALLHQDQSDPGWMDWPRWLRAAGVGAAPPPTGTRFNNYALVIEAALDGRGLALGWLGIIDDLLEDGRLIAVAPPVKNDDYGYILRCRAPDDPTVAALAEFLATRWRREATDALSPA